MATFEVTVETIVVRPHPNADRLELAQVGLYNIVVGKGTWVTGDEVLYIPEYAVLPENLIVALGLEGKLAGRQKNRVKPVNLRGELSQGLVAPLSFLPDGVLAERGKDADFSDVLNIRKWEPEVPLALSGDVKAAPEIVRWIDIENLKKFPDMFTDGEHVVVDEKIHGTATCITVSDVLGSTPEVLVTSKGLGGKNLSLKEDDSNVYWRVFREYNLIELARIVAENTNVQAKIGIFGETFGGKIQDLHYGRTNNDLGFVLFDIRIEGVNGFGQPFSRWLEPEVVEFYARAARVPLAPRLFDGPFSMEKIVELAQGAETVSGEGLHIREGVVVRPAANNPDVVYGGKRKIGKFVSDAYLTRKGVDGREPTEFN